MLYLSSHNSKGLKQAWYFKQWGIPEKYLDQILLKLRRSRLVESIRGRHGGYNLPKTLKTYPFGISSEPEDGIYPVECIDEHDGQCANSATCSTSEPWRFIFAFLQNSLKEMTLFDLEILEKGLVVTFQTIKSVDRAESHWGSKRIGYKLTWSIGGLPMGESYSSEDLKTESTSTVWNWSRNCAVSKRFVWGIIHKLSDIKTNRTLSESTAWRYTSTGRLSRSLNGTFKLRKSRLQRADYYSAPKSQKMAQKA